MNPPGRHRRKDAQLQNMKERAERAGWRLHPGADKVRANPAHSTGCIVEIHKPGQGWQVYRYSGGAFE